MSNYLDSNPLLKELVSRLPIPRIVGCGKEFIKKLVANEILIKCGYNYGTTIDMFNMKVPFRESQFCKECVKSQQSIEDKQ